MALRKVSTEYALSRRFMIETGSGKRHDGKIDSIPRGKLLARLVSIVFIVTSHVVTGLVDLARATFLASRREKRAPMAHQVRLTLQDLGPTFVKLGQLLSTRSDILPVEWQRELSKLRDHAASVPAHEIREQVEESVDMPMARFFELFEPAPVACASIAEVHRAILADGRRVAVKIRRPNVHYEIETDLSLLRDLLRFLMLISRRAREYNLVGLLDEFAALLRSETDFVAEAGTMGLIRGLFDGDELVTIPMVVSRGSGHAVLIMDWIEGIPLSNGPGLDESGIERPSIARAVAHAYATMFFTGQRFHADPQPGNLIALPGARLGLVDFGEAGTVSTATRTALVGLVGSLIAKDVEGLTTAVLTFSRATRPVDRVGLGSQLAKLVQPLMNAQLREVRLGQILRDLLRSLHSFGLILPVDLAVLIKTLMVCEATCVEIDPAFDMTTLLAEFQIASASASSPTTPPHPKSFD